MLKLYTAHAEIAFHVVAEDADAAQNAAEACAKEAFEHELYPDVCVSLSKRIEPYWSHGIPYSAKDVNPSQLKVEQILENNSK